MCVGAFHSNPQHESPSEQIEHHGCSATTDAVGDTLNLFPNTWTERKRDFFFFKQIVHECLVSGLQLKL